MPKRVPTPDPARLRSVARVRVIYGDTDKMGVVYHGNYLRYLEHGRVELIRSLGRPYATMEREGLGLPVTDLEISYLAPARYDDLVTIDVGIHTLRLASVVFEYELRVEVGAREGLSEPVVLVHAQTRHACMRMDDGRPTRLPDDIHALMQAHVDERGG